MCFDNLEMNKKTKIKMIKVVFQPPLFVAAYHPVSKFQYPTPSPLLFLS